MKPEKYQRQLRSDLAIHLNITQIFLTRLPVITVDAKETETSEVCCFKITKKRSIFENFSFI